MSTLGEIERWINETLSANAAIANAGNGVYHTLAIQKATAPYVVITPAGTANVDKTLCGAVASVRAVYDIRAVGKDTGFPRIALMEDAINVAVPIGRVTAAGTRPRFVVTILSPIRRVTPGEGCEFYEAGGTYQFFVTP